MNKLICVVGMTGAGKTTIADRFAEKGFTYLRFGQITLDIIQKKGLEVNETNEKKIREGLRKEHGMGAFAVMNIAKIDKLLIDSDVVVDGLYSWSEYKILKDKYGNQMYVLAIYTSPTLRYKRLTERANQKEDIEKRFRATTQEASKKRDYAEIENIEKGGPIVMADFTIKNLGTIKELYNKTDKLMKDLNAD